jgi:hypothetical protein
MSLLDIREIPEFHEDVPIYITQECYNKILNKMHSAGDKGYLIGDLYYYKDEPFILATDIFTDFENLESTGDEQLILGWCYWGEEDPQNYRDGGIEINLLNKPYQVIFQVMPDTGEITAYKIVDGAIDEIDYLITQIRYDDLDIEEPIHLEREIAEIKEVKKLITFMFLSFFALLFGIFGGITAYLVTKDLDKQKRVLLLLFGILSTMMWLLISKGIIYL